MDHKGSSTVCKNRISPTAERYIRVSNRCLGRAVGQDGEVHHVPCMRTIRVLRSMLLACGIKVAAGRGEFRTFALCILVNVDGMFTGRHVPKVELDIHALSGLLPRWGDSGGSSITAGCRSHDYLDGGCSHTNGEDQRTYETQFFHHCSKYLIQFRAECFSA